MGQAKTFTPAEFESVLAFVAARRFAQRNRMLILMSFIDNVADFFELGKQRMYTSVSYFLTRTYCVVSNIKYNSNQRFCLGNITTTLNQIVRTNFEGGWVIFHFKSPCEKPKVIKLPLNKARNLVNQFLIRQSESRLVCSSRVTMDELWSFRIVPNPFLHLTGLLCSLTALYIQN